MNVYPVLVTPAIVPVVHITQGVSITRAVIDAVSLYLGFQISVPVPDPENFEFEFRSQSRILK